MNEEILFQIAKIIDNEYIGKENSFQFKRVDASYWYLSTKTCDWVSFIKVYEKNNKISTIQVLGGYTDGWQDIISHTWGRIGKFLSSLNTAIKPEVSDTTMLIKD